MTAPNTISDPALIDRAIAVFASAGAGHRIPPLRAVRSGAIAMAEVPRGTAITGGVLRRLDTTGRPALLLIGDDDASPSGPAGWRGIDRAERWARATVLHATGGDPAHYQQAVGMTLGYGRLLMIETTAALASAWLDVLPKPTPDRPLLLVLPHPGDTHPRRPERETVQ